jgi:ATP-dependent Clp protease protease subunit
MTKPKKGADLKAVPEYVHRATEQKLLAEARHATAMALGDEMSNRITALQVDKIELGNEYEEAHDARHRVYRFAGPVTEGTAAKCADTLTRWSRIDATRDEKPGDIELVLYSPGGSVVDGMMLFDTIQLLRRQGHRIDTTAIGMAASMGSILLQAGQKRRMTSESWLLLHNLSASAGGALGEIEDRVDWYKKISERTLDIFADRCKKSKGTDKLTRAEIKKKMDRKDLWLSSGESLKFGLVDEVI